MIKLTFQMTAEEFYIGWKYKLKKNNIRLLNPLFLIILVVLIAALAMITKNIFLLIYLLFLALLIVFIKKFQKKNIEQQFLISPTVSSKATLCTYGEGIEIINGYQKIFVPWQSIFSVKETETYLMIIPTYRTSVFVINKQRYSSSELNEIISLLKQNTTVEEGK